MAHHGRSALPSVDLDAEYTRVPLKNEYDVGVSSFWSARGPHDARLSLRESARLHTQWLMAGWRDANRWRRVYALVRSSPKLYKGLLKGLLLSTVLCGLVHFFRLTMSPRNAWEAQGVHDREAQATWIGSVSNAFWLYPLLAGCYFMASSWTTNVADAAQSAQDRSLPTRERTTSWWDMIARAVLILNYSAVCFGLQWIPWIGPPLAFMVMSLVDGYFCFEQVWSGRGWSLEKVRPATN